MTRPRSLLGRSMIVLTAALVVGAPIACGGPPAPGEAIACDEASRVALDCQSEIAYQGVKADGSVSVFSVGAGSASYEDTAIRKVNDGLASYVATQTRLCRDYNACILSKEQYAAEAKKTREVFEAAAHGIQAFSAAGSSAQKAHALTELYDVAVPEAMRPEDLQLRFTLDAELPASLGGARLYLVPGAPLPTGARVAFGFWTSRAAHLYVFQKPKSGAVKVLYPNPEIGTTNPTPAGQTVTIPSGSRRFVLNDEDLGLENIYLVASVKPLASLDVAVRKVESGQVTTLTADPALGALATATVGPGVGNCKTRSFDLEPAAGACATRGLDLEAAAADQKASIAARTAPGDDVIVKVFPFDHVSEADYPAALQRHGAKPPPH